MSGLALLIYGSIAIVVSFGLGVFVGAASNAPYLPDDMTEPTHPSTEHNKRTLQ